MKRREMDRKLDRALLRLGDVSPEALHSATERVRRNLKAGAAARLIVTDALDTSAASLWSARLPIIAGSMLLLIMVGGTIGTVASLKSRRPASPRRHNLSPESFTARSAPDAGGERKAKGAVPESRADTAQSSAKPEESGTRLTAPSLRQSPAIVARSGPRPNLQPTPALPAPDTQFALMPPGAGKLILDRACSGCHRAGAVATYHFVTRAEYASVVSRMIDMGAPVSAQDSDVLIDYLFDNFGIKSEPRIETDGKAILERACTTCHALNGIENYSYSSLDPYRELVTTMISYGATLNDADKSTLVQYLFATYGKR